MYLSSHILVSFAIYIKLEYIKGNIYQNKQAEPDITAFVSIT